MKRKLILISSLLLLGIGGLTSCKNQITIDITTNTDVLSSSLIDDETSNNKINKEDNTFNFLSLK